MESLEWLYPSPPLLYAALALGLLLDALYPWHSGLLLYIHPVHTAYTMARRLAPPYSSRLRGAAAWAAVIASHLALYAALLYAAMLASPVLWVAAAAYIVKVSCPLTPLFDAVRRAHRCMERGDWSCARVYAQWLVRRNVWKLDESHVVSAVVESLAESLVDGYTSPLTYYTLAGPLGALAQRLVNTLDSALGYKTPEWREAGWLAAKADDIVNFIPARATAALMTLLSPLAGGSPRRALRVWLRDARRLESPNAGHPIAAMAGTLGVWLEKPGYYRVGGGEDPQPEHIPRALRLAAATAAVYTLVAMLAVELLARAMLKPVG